MGFLPEKCYLTRRYDTCPLLAYVAILILIFFFFFFFFFFFKEKTMKPASKFQDTLSLAVEATGESASLSPVFLIGAGVLCIWRSLFCGRPPSTSTLSLSPLSYAWVLLTIFMGILHWLVVKFFYRFWLIIYFDLQNCSSLVKLEDVVLGEVLVSIFCFVMFCINW
jgi:hypothetical protein